MANREVIALNESTPQLEAAQTGDTYLFPRAQFNDGTVYIKDAAGAAADVAGYGQLWVDNATPDKLKFTDDAGTDFGVLTDAGNVPLTANWDVGAFDLTCLTLNVDGDTSAGDGAAVGYTAAEGIILTGQGSTYDVTIKNDADANCIQIPTGATGVEFPSLTASEIVITSATKGLASAAVATYPSLTELTYLKGATSAVQTQLTSGVNALATHVAGGASQEVTATADGLTTGLITATSEFVSVICDDATKQVSLPAAVDGKVLRILPGGAENVELISIVAGDKVNNVTVGATNEALLVKTTMYTLVYDLSTTNWFMQGITFEGAVETPVVPDARA